MEAVPQEILDARNKLKAKFGNVVGNWTVFVMCRLLLVERETAEERRRLFTSPLLLKTPS